jgi:nucleoside-diphosphate-sugar epimerase
LNSDVNSDESSALIGYTGFVGGNLLRQRSFDALFNSANVEQIAGRSFELVVCSGAPAEKWKANANPEADRANIERLIRALDGVNADKVVLISTVDVFSEPAGVDEASPVSMSGLQAYGKHRRLLEELVLARFDALVVRLPGLYGHGLKKNIIFDFLHDNAVDKADSRGQFQFYGIDRLWHDIEVAIDAAVDVVHLPTEPVTVADVARVAFGREFVNELSGTPARYDIHTRYAALFGGEGVYIEDRDRELAGIRAFVDREREL